MVSKAKMRFLLRSHEVLVVNCSVPENGVVEPLVKAEAGLARQNDVIGKQTGACTNFSR